MLLVSYWVDESTKYKDQKRLVRQKNFPALRILQSMPSHPLKPHLPSAPITAVALELHFNFPKSENPADSERGQRGARPSAVETDTKTTLSPALALPPITLAVSVALPFLLVAGCSRATLPLQSKKGEGNRIDTGVSFKVGRCQCWRRRPKVSGLTRRRRLTSFRRRVQTQTSCWYVVVVCNINPLQTEVYVIVLRGGIFKQSETLCNNGRLIECA